VRSNLEYTNTWEELSTKTFGSGMGGYLRLRRENNINYIDYLNDSPYISGQTIELSKNLLDYEKTVKASDIVTVLIPLGAKLKDEEGNELDERLTIESVNAGSKFIEHSGGIAKYGRIVGYKIWDDINSPSLLKTRATNDLNFLVNLGISMKIKAIDLSMIKEPELWGRNLLLLSDTPSTLIGIKWTDYTGKKWSEI
jgi:phage minor structural protein